MDRLGIHLLIAAPMLIGGLLLAGIGCTRLVRHLNTAIGPWWKRLWSIQSVLPAYGLLILTQGVLAALGFFDAAIGVMYGIAATFVIAAGVSAVRSARAGNRRGAALLAAVAMFLLVSFSLIPLQWDTASNVVFAVGAGGLVTFSIAMLARRWRSSSSTQRHSLLQSLTLTLAMSCMAAARLLPADLRSAVHVLDAVAVFCLLLTFALLFIIRQQTGRRANRIIAVLALAVSVGTSFWIFRAEQRRSVRPDLQLSFGWGGEAVRLVPGAGWDIRNTGNGPAVVRWLEVKVDGKPLFNWPDVLRALGAKLDDEAKKEIEFYNGSRILLNKLDPNKPDTWHKDKLLWARPGSPLAQFLVQESNRVDMVSHHKGAMLEHVEIVFCYCSIYDECWLTRGAPPGRSCDDPPANEFNYAPPQSW